MSVRFGTDGIRGVAGIDITVELAYRLGRAVASVFGIRTVIGYDTRESSEALAHAVAQGLADGGVAVTNLGVFTTPGVAVMAEHLDGVGIVISASHNPFSDNGLKVFGRGGTKLDQETEAAVQDALNAAPTSSGPFGAVAIDTSAREIYLNRLRATRPDNLLAGLRLVLDCANGASFDLAPELFRSLGATVDVIHAAPNGRNINTECGSTHPEDLQATVTRLGANLGLAFDGDADRLVAVDERGERRDGDDLMVLFALDLHERKELDTLVITSMSNLGLRQALQSAGIALRETDVGDRNVLVALEEADLPFGGEQSGHLIFRNELATGDGMLSGIHLAELIVRSGPLGEQCDAAWRRAPQFLVNVPRDSYDEAKVQALIDAACAAQGVAKSELRIVIRPSGTEPVIRVMVESINGTLINELESSLRAEFL
jgi:phosphoglucosamine mutase